jgi:GTP cyclohydrolase IA
MSATPEMGRVSMNAELELLDDDDALDGAQMVPMPVSGAGAVDLPRAERAVEELLDALGYSVRSESLAATPRRVAKSLAELLTARPYAFTTFPNEEDYDEMVVVRDIPFHSLCEHHLLPFFGVAHVGYIPVERIVGLSKLARVVEATGRRLQVQERMTTQIATYLNEALVPGGVAVVLEAEHLCMTIRGVAKPGARTVTSTLLGAFRDNAQTRQEFLSVCGISGRPA